MRQIVEAIKDNRCIIFSGAGLSRNAGLPDWLGLARQLCNKLKEEKEQRGEQRGQVYFVVTVHEDYK